MHVYAAVPMPRRPRDLTPSETTGTPTDASPPTPVQPAPLPRPPSVPKPPRLPATTAPAKPGRRGETPSDMQMTGRIERVRGDATPAPLPPSPGARDAERWFEQVPTNPALVGDPRDSTANQRKMRTSSVRLTLPSQASDAPDRPWLLPTLIAAIALTIGMILGALLFSRSGSDCKPCVETAPATPAQPKQ